MTAPAPEKAEPPEPGVLDPPSLRRRGPARLDISTKSGCCPSMNGQRLHVRAGRTLVVQVVPPSPVAKVEITTDPAIHTVVSVSPVGTGPVPTYHGEYCGHLPLRVIPWPVTAKLYVVVQDGLPNPCRVTIPVTVWPSVPMMAAWWVLVFLGIAGLRWRDAVVNSSSALDVLPRIKEDVPYLIGLFFLLGIPLLVLLRILGWVVNLWAHDEEP